MIRFDNGFYIEKGYYDEDGNYRDNWCIYDAGKLYLICFSYSEAYELASNFVRECN